nr:redox-regulatory protein [Quercus suber]
MMRRQKYPSKRFVHKARPSHGEVVQANGVDTRPYLLRTEEQGRGIVKKARPSDALEIWSYLHDHGLIQYGDEIESDGRCLSELLNLSHEELSSQFEPAEPRVCGCVKPPPIVDTVAPYSAIESISIQRLTPEYKLGMELLVKTKTPPMKASELWRDKPAVLLCIRRPGCILCRAEAHQLYAKKPIFDALGVQLFAVLHEQIDSEVKYFWPRYWGGAVLFDRGMEFFNALGGGKLLKEKFLSGFVFNPGAIANYKRAKAMGIIEQNFRGEAARLRGVHQKTSREYE